MGEIYTPYVPAVCAWDEFIKNLTDLVNNSMLPPFVVEDVLKDAYNKVVAISKKQLEEDIERYKAELKNKQHS